MDFLNKCATSNGKFDEMRILLKCSLVIFLRWTKVVKIVHIDSSVLFLIHGVPNCAGFVRRCGQGNTPNLKCQEPKATRLIVSTDEFSKLAVTVSELS